MFLEKLGFSTVEAKKLNEAFIKISSGNMAQPTQNQDNTQISQ